jgi:hypothetical protein
MQEKEIAWRAIFVLLSFQGWSISVGFLAEWQVGFMCDHLSF